MRKSELDATLEILENSVRRRIIRRLSEEPNYPLQLAKELGLGQQLVAKHLNTMEEAGFVKSSMEESPKGPKRRTYLLMKSMSITLDIAPNHYNTRVLSFISPSQENIDQNDHKTLMDTADRECIKHTKKEANRIKTTLLTEIDKQLVKLEDHKSVLLCLRHFLMSKNNQITSNINGKIDAKHLLTSMISRHGNVENVSKMLKLKESAVQKIVEKLKEDLIPAYQENGM